MSAEPLISIVVPIATGEEEWRGLLAQLSPLAPCCEVLLAAATPQPPDLAACVKAAAGSSHASEYSGPRFAPVARAPLAAGPARSQGLMDSALASRTWTDPAALDVQWLQASAGRASQQNAAAGVARAPLLWFLHADSRLQRGAVAAVAGCIMPTRIEALGWFRLAFHDGSRRHRLNAFGANLRSRLFGLPFGDQGLLLPARQFRDLGGFDESLQRGEDLDLVLRARRAGLRLQALDATIATSARRYRQHGWWRTTREHLALTLQLRREALARLRSHAH